MPRIRTAFRFDESLWSAFVDMCDRDATTPTIAITNFMREQLFPLCSHPTPVVVPTFVPTPSSSEIDVRSIVAEMMREHVPTFVPTPAAGIDRDTIQQMIDESFANQAEEDEDDGLDVTAYLNEQVRQAMARHRQTVKLDEQVKESIACTVTDLMTRDGELQSMVQSMVTGEWDGSTYIPDHAEVKRMIKVATDENVHGYMDLLAKIDRLKEMILADSRKSKGGSGKGFSTLSTGVDKTLYEV